MRTIAKMTYLRWWRHLPTEILDSYYRVMYRLSEAYKKFFFAPIYYEYWSRDCDMCESAGVTVFYGGRKAYEKAYQEAEEWADGPFSWDIITKIVTGKPYREVYDALNEISKKMGMWHTGSYEKNAYGRKFVKKSSARTGVWRKVYEHYLLGYCGMKWIPLMEVGKGCQVHLVEDELPMGRLICRLSGHLTAVIDHVIHDTFDPSREVHCTRPNDGQPLRRGEWLHPNGDVICSIQRRCVYGYFIKKEQPPKKEAKPVHQFTKFNEPVQFNFIR